MKCTGDGCDFFGQDRRGTGTTRVRSLRWTVAKTFGHDRKADRDRPRPVRTKFLHTVRNRHTSVLRYRRLVHRPAPIDPLQHILPDRGMVHFEFDRSLRGGVFGHYSSEYAFLSINTTSKYVTYKRFIGVQKRKQIDYFHRPWPFQVSIEEYILTFQRCFNFLHF